MFSHVFLVGFHQVLKVLSTVQKHVHHVRVSKCICPVMDNPVID